MKGKKLLIIGAGNNQVSLIKKEIAETDSDWVKIRNQIYLELLDSADGKLMDILEKKIDNI